MLFSMLASRWNQLCENTKVDTHSGWTAITTAYGNPVRAYHNLHHIADCLHLLDQYAGLAADPVAMEFAIWFHDIVYDPRAADNEERSADRAVEFLSTTPHAAKVADLIMATKHGKDGLSADSALICDIDLSILGRPPAEYAAYAAAIRLEYAWVPPQQYTDGRSRVLGGFLKRPALFNHPEFQQRFEAPAKANLAWELRELVKDSPSQVLAPIL
jgi:predicted metal-dependent HD superfamily phosphohydrolase